MTTTSLYDAQDSLAILAARITTLRDNPDVVTAYKRALASYISDPAAGMCDPSIFEALETHENLITPIDDLLQIEIERALKDAFQAGLLKAPSGPTGNTAFEDRWSTLLEDGWDKAPAYIVEQLCEALADILRRNFIEAKSAAETPPADIAANIFDMLRTGTFETSLRGGQMLNNFSDGQPLCLAMTNWEPAFFTLEEGKRTQPTPMPHGKIFHLPVEFPTGKLLVADAVHIGSIHEQRLALTDKAKLSINYALHRVIRTVLSSRLLGAIDVSCYDDDPGFVLDTKSGYLHLADAKGDCLELADVCHDYSGAMLVDRADTLKLLAKDGMTEDEANAAIDAWLADSPYHNEITVTPGTWHLYWDDDRETLENALCKGHPMPSRCRLTLAPSELSFDAPVSDFTAFAEAMAEQFGPSED